MMLGRINMNDNKKIRVRFAPSPTGYLHIGGARTALYNWLFAKRNNGIFILRIEDTDEVRSTDESIGGIIESLKWLGLDWDEGPASVSPADGEKGGYGPYFQMRRLETYKKYAGELLQTGRAYKCYCSREELEKMRSGQSPEKGQSGYDGRCRDLAEEQRKKYEQEGRLPVIRFRMSREGKTEFNDIIREKVSFENNALDDLVILKANGIPTYNFVCVVDDHLMEITHVIRGEDHLSNTPKQLQIYDAFGWPHPEFAHLSMILGSDGTRLSKRHGATSVLEYRKMGYLSETLFNYLSLLGWSNEESRQLFERDELVREFSLERCSRSAAKFDTDRLVWMNGEYIRKKGAGELYSRALSMNFLDTEGIKDFPEEKVTAAIGLVHEKFKLLQEIPGMVDFLLKDNINYNDEAVNEVLLKPGTDGLLSGIRDRISGMPAFDRTSLESLLREYAKENKIKTAVVFHPVRVAVSGRTTGPGLFEILEFLGRDKVIKRLDHAIALCR